MSSQLSAVPIESRRRIAATVGLFAALFVAIGAVAATGTGPAAAPVFSVVSLGIALVLALIAWGLVRTIKIDRAEARLDDAIEATMKSHGGYESMCDCGHEHDPGELHITDSDEAVSANHVHSAACSHDGTGAACAHNCDTCVLAALRPSPTATRSERAAG